MAETAMIRARVDPPLKAEAEGILQELGLSTTEVITLFYQQIWLNEGLPFPIIFPTQNPEKRVRARQPSSARLSSPCSGRSKDRDSSIKDEPFVGMWNEPGSMKNRSGWVRQTRERDWKT